MFELQGLVTVDAKPDFVSKVLTRAVKGAQIEIEGFLPSNWEPRAKTNFGDYACHNFLLTLEKVSDGQSSGSLQFSLTIRVQGRDEGTSLIYTLKSEKENQTLNTLIFNRLATILETSLK